MLAILLTVVGAAMLLLGGLVFVKNPHDRTNRSFFSFVLLITAWMTVNVFSSNTSITIQSVVWVDRFVMALPALSLYALLVFAWSFTGSYSKLANSLKRLAGLSTIGIVVASLSPYIIANIVRDPGGNEVVFGLLAPFYLLYVAGVFTWIVAVLIRATHRAKPVERARYQYVLASLFATIFLVVLTNLLMPYLFGVYALVPYGPLWTALIAIGFSYAIVRHRLFDIRLIIARSLAYFLLLVTITTLYSLALFGITRIVFKQDMASFSQNAVNIALMIILAWTFQPLRRFFEHVTDRFFYRDRYDSQVVLKSLSDVMVSELNLDRMLGETLRRLCHQLRISFAQIIIFDDHQIYKLVNEGELPTQLIVSSELKHFGQGLLVADELDSGPRKEIMEEHGLRVSIMLETKEEFVGYLLLGDKLSGNVYSDQDLELFEILAKQLAVATLNAKAYLEIQEFNRTLQDRIDHATSRLRVANRHLKELDRAKDEFISMASHQLRTPLTTIKGYLSMLLEGDAGKVTKAQAEFIDYAFGASERMVNLISDLLNVSRLSAGRFLIQTKPTDMSQMIADEVRQLQTHAVAKNLKLVFVPPAKPLPLAEIDENKTRQVVMNFIDNAIYYTHQGSVTVRLTQSGDMAQLEVMDTGIGVPEAARKKLFSKFFRADNAQTVRPDGTGLGLYLAKRVVEDQGGTIIFNSVEGQGSTFGFQLPFKAVNKERKV